ncbi:MAG: hypothetical protein WD379_09065 [Dehalococcoidia bacterium]
MRAILLSLPLAALLLALPAADNAAAFPPDAIDVQTDTVRPEDDLLFTSVRHLASQPPAGEQWRPEVFAMDLQTLQHHRLTFMDTQVMRHMAASPDRSKLAITRILGDTNGSTNIDELDDQVIWIIDLPSGKAWPLTEDATSAGAGGLDWLDDSTLVFNRRALGDSQYDLATANYLTGAVTLLTNTPTIIETDVGASVDGDLLSYIATDTTDILGSDEFGPLFKSKVWVMNADGSDPRQVTDGGALIGRAGPLSAGDYDPELSPDNSKVVFGRAVALGANDIDPGDPIPPAGTHRVYTADVDTLQVAELTQNDSVALIPDWDFDGTIYFAEIAITAEHAADPYLGIATTSEAGGLTRLEPFPPQDIWKGALVAKLLPSLDSDSDGALDPVDPCPADPDCDADTFSDGVELHMGADPLLACPVDTLPDNEQPDPWPPDADDDRAAEIGDVIALFRDIVLIPAAYQPRSDFTADGSVNVGDVIAGYGGGKILSSCS